jgi:tRNA U38,U39,U40 pseudouridine synthase TruA
MKKNQNPTKETIAELKNLFLDTIKLVDKYLGDKAFSNFGETREKWASLTNRSLYDAEMLAFADFVGKEVEITSEEFVKNLKQLMVDSEFKRSLHSQAGGKMIEKRVSEIKKIISNSEP